MVVLWRTHERQIPDSTTTVRLNPSMGEELPDGTHIRVRNARVDLTRVDPDNGWKQHQIRVLELNLHRFTVDTQADARRPDMQRWMHLRETRGVDDALEQSRYLMNDAVFYTIPRRSSRPGRSSATTTRPCT